MWRSLANRKLGLQLTNEKDESEIELTKIDVKFCQQMKSSTVFPESSALRLRRSISNTVERKPLDDITLHEACKDHLVRDIEELLSDPSCDVNGFDARGLTALHYAAKNDLDDVTKILLENGADVDIHDPCNRSLTPLQMACWFNSYDTVRLLLANGADVNKNSRYGQLAIHYAASRSGVEIVEELLVKGKANPNGKDNSGFTPLHIAAARGRLEIVNALLKHGANITLQDNDGYTPVHIASREGHVTTLRALLQSALATGVSMRYILESTGAGSCLQLAVKKCHIETAKICLEYGASTYGNAHDTTPPLHTACIHGNLDMVQLLVMSGASIDAEDIEGMTPILRASLFGHAKIVNFLIDQGANLEAAGPGQPSPLMCAVTKGHADVIKLLLSRGCSIDVRDASHRTCVHVAVYSENERTLDTLLEYGGKILVNSQDKSECTPLHFAAINRSLKMILKLLDFGADTNILDDEEKLPLHHAAEAGDLECFQALVVVNPSSIHKTDLRLRTALYYAALENKDDIIKFLIESGAHVNSRDDDRLTPLLAIAPSGCAQTVTMLLDHGAKIDDLSKNRATALTVASIYGNTDVVKVLLDRGASIDGDWSIGHGCLASAIRGGQKQTCMEIIKHKRWKENLKVKGSEGFTCMKGLIEHFPEVAKLALDKCIVTSSNLAPTDENYSITYNFEFLNVHPDERSNSEGYIYFGPQSMMQSTASRDLLFHPLTKQLLDLKWNRFSRYHTIASVTLYVMFVVNITLYMLCFDQQNFQTGNVNDKQTNYCTKDAVTIQSYGVGVFTVLWLLGHVYRLFKERWGYFDGHTQIEDLTLFTCLMAAFSDTNKAQFEWGIIALIMCYLTLLFYFQMVFSSGIYVTMLFGVLKSFVKVITTFVALLLVFGILFYLLLYSPLRKTKVLKGVGTNANVTVDIEHPFQDIFLSSVKVVAMMIGELEYTRFFVEQTNESIVLLTIAVFLAFCAFLPIVLMNLLIGLAVGDIDTVQKNAEIKLLAIKIDIIYEIEQKMPAIILRHFYRPHIVVYPNKKNTGFCHKLKAVRNQLASNTTDYEDILEDQEREDIESMEEVMTKMNNKIDEQDQRISQVLKDIQQQRVTLDKLSSILFQRNDADDYL